MAEREEDKGFVVRDRRRFTEDGTPREGADEREGSTPPPGAAQAAADALRSGPRGPNPEQEPTPVGQAAPRKIDFTTFVFSLGSSALIHLGDAPHPETGEIRRDLALARESIDLIDMLREKTKGNLTPEEERFLGALLYDLRMRFVAAAKG